jgi:hypothetical protein
VREALKASIRDGTTYTAIVIDVKVGGDVRGDGDGSQVCESEYGSAASPENEAKTYRNTQTQARPFLKVAGRQKLGKRGYLGL